MIIVEYDHNILSKVEKFELQLKKWMYRNLTIKGKMFIINNLWPFTTYLQFAVLWDYTKRINFS